MRPVRYTGSVMLLHVSLHGSGAIFVAALWEEACAQVDRKGTLGEDHFKRN